MKTKILILLLLIVLIPFSVNAAPVPATGQTSCYNNDGKISCPQPGEAFYGQDAQYATVSHTFTDLGNGIIRDNITGLEWQQETAPGSYTVNMALAYCESSSLGGHDDWRLPTVKELLTLVECGITGPEAKINITFFYDTEPSSYWTSQGHLNGEGVFDWYYVSFFEGDVYFLNKLIYFRSVRAVRSGQQESSGGFVDNRDGTVTHSSTGLMWQQATAPGTYDWKQALAYCESLELSGYDDWRLPNRNELLSIVDHNREDLLINTSYFSDTEPSSYWTSTTSMDTSSNTWFLEFTDAWEVNFINGFVHNSDKTDNNLWVFNRICG